MARTIAQVVAQIEIQMAQYPVLQPVLANDSAVAIWSKIVYCVAFAIVSLEQIYDAHKLEVAELLALQKPHTKRWYQQKALSFQLGGILLVDDDKYDNSLLTEVQIVTQKIIKRAAAVEENTVLTIKVAKMNGIEPVPLSSSEYIAFYDYMQDIKDAGVKINVISDFADVFQAEIDIYYDPSAMASNGALLDGSSANPVEDTVKEFLALLPFNGVFIKSALVDAIQKVQGVVTPVLKNCSASPFGANQTTSIDAYYKTHAGYMNFDPQQGLIINYIPYNV
jgi:hypothetical protein